MEDCEIDGKKLTLAYAKPQFTQFTQKPKTQPSVQSAEKAKVQSKQKPGSQPEKPVSKDQPSAGKTKLSKRRRNRKKGNVEMHLGFFQIYLTTKSFESKCYDNPNS